MFLSYDKTSLKFCASFRIFLAVFIEKFHKICYLNYVRRGIIVFCRAGWCQLHALYAADHTFDSLNVYVWDNYTNMLLNPGLLYYLSVIFFQVKAMISNSVSCYQGPPLNFTGITDLNSRSLTVVQRWVPDICFMNESFTTIKVNGLMT